jgi:hypothetical protein
MTFEQRRYEQLRLEKALGRTALDGYERRRYDEITSGLAEALSGRVDTEYSFSLQNNKFVADDGEPIEDMLLRALQEDIKTATSDGFYNFLPHRSRAELDNFRSMQLAAAGQETYNTQIEISVYNEELDTSETNRRKLMHAAQMPEWGRTMVRLSHWDGEKLNIMTMSSDNLPPGNESGISSTNLFKEAAKRSLGYKFAAGDANGMLAEPIRLRAEGDNWKQLAKGLVSEADNILSEKYGGHWLQGRPESEAVDLQKYVESQAQVLEGLFDVERKLAKELKDFDSYKAAFNKELRKAAALLEHRLTLGKTSEAIVDYQAAATGAGAWADAEGKSYNMCGLVLGAENTNLAQQTGSESLARLIGQPVECPFCEKKVVVPAKDLEQGKLYCNNCDTGVDVCTGEKFNRNKDKRNNLRYKKSFADELIDGWLEWNRRYQEEKAVKQAQRQTAQVKSR